MNTLVIELKKQGLTNAEIARQVGLSGERISQIIGKSPEAQKKAEARRILRYAISSGKIVKCPCMYCMDEKSEAHHVDYDKPLDVIWVCKKHHRQIHNSSRVRAVSDTSAERTARKRAKQRAAILWYTKIYFGVEKSLDGLAGMIVKLYELEQTK